MPNSFALLSDDFPALPLGNPRSDPHRHSDTTRQARRQSTLAACARPLTNSNDKPKGPTPRRGPRVPKNPATKQPRVSHEAYHAPFLPPPPTSPQTSSDEDPTPPHAPDLPRVLDSFYVFNKRVALDECFQVYAPTNVDHAWECCYSALELNEEIAIVSLDGMKHLLDAFKRVAGLKGTLAQTNQRLAETTAQLAKLTNRSMASTATQTPPPPKYRHCGSQSVPLPTTSIGTQASPAIVVTTSAAVQAAPETFSMATQCEAPPAQSKAHSVRSLSKVKTYASSTVQATAAPIAKPIAASTLPPVLKATSYAQVAKSATPPTTRIAPPVHSCPPTAPVTDFKGRRATRLSELHFQLASRSTFNLNLSKINFDSWHDHRHSLVTTFGHALCQMTVDGYSNPLVRRAYSRGLKSLTDDPLKRVLLDAVFWSPKGNLIVRTKHIKVSDDAKRLIIDTVSRLAGGPSSFILLERPPLSLLKITGFPTNDVSGSPVNTDDILADMFSDPRLTNASFWHTPRFVTYKGAPVGNYGTLFFSVTDSANFDIGRSLVDTRINVLGHTVTIRQWHPRRPDHQRHAPRFYAEGKDEYYKAYKPFKDAAKHPASIPFPTLPPADFMVTPRRLNLNSYLGSLSDGDD